MLHRNEKDTDDLKNGLIIGGAVFLFVIACVSVAVVYRYSKFCTYLRKAYRIPQEQQEQQELHEQKQGNLNIFILITFQLKYKSTCVDVKCRLMYNGHNIGCKLSLE